ncbi:MAG: LacI family transcriptional regulator [bacterium]|nr:LacI family transcriptional regulator [bacterium]
MRERGTQVRRRVTQQDVAERAGVTRATVSYVLSGGAAAARITPEVAERVRAAAAELGYVPNIAARVLASGRTRTLGLVIGGVPQGINPFWGRIAEGAEAEALVADYSVLLISEAGIQTPADLLRMCHGRIDGLLVLGETLREHERALLEMPWPVVAVQPGCARKVATVALDAAPGIRAAVEHLAKLGHRRIGWVGPPIGMARVRAHVTREAANACGLSCRYWMTRAGELPLSHPLDRIIAHWEGQIKEVLPQRLPVTAVVCWNDRVALGLYRVLAKRGLYVPRDISVIGFDDLEGPLADPPLSSVSHEFKALGRAATRLVLRLLRGWEGGGKGVETHVEVAAHFVRRESTGRASADVH